MLILHIMVAVLSIGIAGISYMHPSRNKINLSYAFVAATLLTGTYLVVFGRADLVKTCFTGIIYLAFVTAGLVAAHKKLAGENTL